MEVSAKLRFLRMSPRKVRLVADLVRGLPVDKAEYQLNFLPRNAATPVLKLMKSAMANAENNFHLDKDKLFVKRITVDQGPTLKRWRPRAFGRAAEIMKRSSHITIILDELAKSGSKKKIKADKIAKPELAKKKSEKIKNPVVDYKEVKHESKFKKEAEAEEPLKDQKKSTFSLTNIKDKFSRRLGER